MLPGLHRCFQSSGIELSLHNLVSHTLGLDVFGLGSPITACGDG